MEREPVSEPATFCPFKVFHSILESQCPILVEIGKSCQP
jgi:hypothetical protein